MGKRIAFILVIISITVSSYADQPDGHFADWGGVTIDELKMQGCSFDKNADAMLLKDIGETYYKKTAGGYFTNNRFRITTAYYMRYKVFKETGTKHADFKIFLDKRAYEEANNIKAVCYNLVNGEIKKTELKPENIYTTEITRHISQVSFSVPGVTEGSVFEVGYEREQDVSYTLPAWYFTGDVPCAYSRLTVGFLDAIDYYVNRHIINDTLEERGEDFTSDILMNTGYNYNLQPLPGRAVTYIARNVPACKPEPYISSERNYKNWIGFQLRSYKDPLPLSSRLISSFDKLVAHMYSNEFFTAGLDGDPVPAKLIKPLLEGVISEEQIAHIVYDYVRSNMKWNGNSGYAPNQYNSKTWREKTGSRADINMLLISTLRQAGIKAYPMIISSRSTGTTNQSYPILSDFIGLDVLVVLNGDHRIVLDATDKFITFGEPCIAQLNTLGFGIQDRTNYFWYRIRDKSGSSEKVKIKAALDENGAVKGTVDIVCTNHLAEHMIQRKETGHDGAAKDYVKKKMPNAEIESVTDSADVVHGTFSLHVAFSTQAIQDNTGTAYVSLASIYGEAVNPFVLKERTADIDFSYMVKTVRSMELSYPSSYTVDSVAASAAITLSDTSAVCRSSADMMSGAVSIVQQLEYKRSIYPAAMYPEFYEFEKQYFDIGQRPVVFRKKGF